MKTKNIITKLKLLTQNKIEILMDGDEPVSASTNVDHDGFGSCIRHLPNHIKQEIVYLLCQLKSLRKIDLRRSLIGPIDIDFTLLRHLEYLDLGSCDIMNVPETICSLHKLKYLNLAVNKLKKTPENLANLQNLEYLLLHKNKISIFHDEYASFKKLKYLNLYLNMYRSIPEQVWNYVTLETFLGVFLQYLKYLMILEN